MQVGSVFIFPRYKAEDHMKHKAQKGFTLVEMILTLVLLGLVSGMVLTLLSGPFQGYFFAKRMLKMSTQLDQVSTYFQFELSQAFPQSIESDPVHQTLTFRKVLYKTFAQWEKLQGAWLLSIPPEELLKAEKIAQVAFLSEDLKSVEVVLEKRSNQTWLKPVTRQSLAEPSLGGVYLLSEPITYQYDSKSFKIVRMVNTNRSQQQESALIGVVTQCTFNWQPKIQALQITLSEQEANQSPFTLIQQVNFEHAY